MRLSDAQPGDVVIAWHQVSERDAAPIYARVLKVCSAMWVVQSEFADKPQRVYPAAFSSKVKPGSWFPDALALCVAQGQQPSFPFPCREAL